MWSGQAQGTWVGIWDQERKGLRWSEFTLVRLGSVEVAPGRLGLSGLGRNLSASPVAPAALSRAVSQGTLGVGEMWEGIHDV